MAWRGQGGKRAKGRRGQDPELDNTAWLAELEREAAQAGDDDEEDWASTLRSRRSPNPPPPTPPAGERRGWEPTAPGSPPPPAAEPGWAPGPDPSSPPAPDYGLFGDEPAGGGPGAGAGSWGAGSAGGGSWGAGSADQPPDPAPAPDPGPDPDWSSWRSSAADPFEPTQGPVPADPSPPGSGQDYWGGSRGSDGDQGWQAADVDTPTGAWTPGEPVSREPDYPALFGELYRRGAARSDPDAARQDPVWEAPDHPLPDQGQPESSPGGWPFEETTGTWEPSDRSFIWPAEELPSTQVEWDQPAPQSWLDDPGPPASTPAPDETAAWPAPSPQAWSEPEPAPQPSPWAGQPGASNGASPAGPAMPPMSSTGPLGPPPAGPPPPDWAAAIPTDVPAARRAADPGAAPRAWRPDEAVEAEPGVPLGAGPGTGGAGFGGAQTSSAAGTGGTRVAGSDPMPWEEPEDEAGEAQEKGRRKRPAGGRQARAWPRIVAVISWIVLVMVVCWFYVFPWLERVLPENF